MSFQCPNIKDCELLKLKDDFGLIISSDYDDYNTYMRLKFKESTFYNSLFLFRDSQDSPFGKLFLRDVFLCDTIENLLYRFPCGNYMLKNTFSPKFKTNLYEITGIPGRSRILIHAANYQNDLKGCVATGVRTKDYVSNSKITLDRIMYIIKCNSINQICVRYA